MNTYHNLLFLTKSFEKQLNQASFLRAYSVYKNQIDFTIRCKNGEVKRLIFSTNPNATCLFLDDDRPTRQNNITYFFEQIHHRIISHIQTIENERVVVFHFEEGVSLVFKLYGNKPNVYLFKDNEELAVESFKKEQQGVLKSALTSPKKTIYQDFSRSVDLTNPKEVLTAFIPTLNRAYLKEIVEQFGLTNAFLSIVEDISLYLKAENTAFRVLNDGSVTNLPEKYLTRFDTLKSFSDINEAIKWSFLHQATTKNFTSQKSQLLQLVLSTIKRKIANLSQLESPEIALNRANEYESMAHSLMAYGSTVDWSMLTDSIIELPSTEEMDQTLKVQIDQKLSAIQNAEKLYAKARYNRSRIKEYEELANNLTVEIESLQVKLADLESIQGLTELKDWQKKHKPFLSSLQNTTKQEAMDLPFRVIRVRDIEVWVGKNAKSNDELVRAAHKEDVWFHARGVPGSHVLIRMNNQKSMPNMVVIESVAQLAAYYSKLKGSALVPVSYAKKKFVRKPKNAVPGLVVLDKEETILVAPKKQLSW